MTEIHDLPATMRVRTDEGKTMRVTINALPRVPGGMFAEWQEEKEMPEHTVVLSSADDPSYVWVKVSGVWWDYENNVPSYSDGGDEWLFQDYPEAVVILPGQGRTYEEALKVIAQDGRL